MPFKNGNLKQSYCAFENTPPQEQQQQQQHNIYSSASHGKNTRQMFQHIDYNSSYFTLSPHDNEYLQHEEHMEAMKNYDKGIFQLDNFVFPTPEEEKEPLNLPCGWTISGRKQSIFEVETNIHTLGELYSTLIELRNQLPPEDLNKNEEQPPEPPSFISRHSSSFTMSDNFTDLSSRRSSSNFSLSSSFSPSEEEEDLYHILTSTYPNFIFESLLDLGTSSCCCAYLYRKKLAKPLQMDKMNKSFASALFAFSALHAIICHSDKYGIYSFLNNLASDAYYTAHELLEFDETSITTVETLVLMYHYLLLLGKEGEARNLFCLAWRHMEIIKQSHHCQRLLLWMAELDWTYSIAKDCPLIIDPKHISGKNSRVSSTIDDRDVLMEDRSLQYRIKGLYLILRKRQLNEWRSKYLQMFLYKRDSARMYCIEDKLALRLHALYFCGMLQYYQDQMMTAFKFEEDVHNEWTDYFSSTTTKTKAKVEKSLCSCMNAAQGFIQVVKLLLDEGDICQLPFMMDTLSAAYTVLYFGGKVTHKVLPQDVLLFIVRSMANSCMIQCVRVDRFVKTWTSLL